ncbi:MAG: GGDEF domain-containing protein, partial [Clostridiales bacterium]|nr:GGDEF domain-containing protein [Clostridiales bacterium]
SIFDFDDFTDLFKAMLEKLITVFEDCNQASVLEIDDSGFIRIICSAGYFKIDDSGFSMKAQDSLIWSYIDGNLGKISIINSNIQAADSKPADVYPIISNCPVASSVLIPVIKSGRTNWIITMDSCIRGRFNAKDLVVAEYIQEEMPILVRMLDLHHENIVFARFDHLTGMMNRGYFNTILEDRLEIARHSNEPMHFVSFDLNGLKKVNDSLGHLAGDIYIGAFARMLQGKIQKSDASGRVGGDEFACIFSNSSRNEILNLITDFQNEFKNLELRYGETTFRGSFSFGIASYGLDSCDKEKLLQIADQRMYENKAEQSI